MRFMTSFFVAASLICASSFVRINAAEAAQPKTKTKAKARKRTSGGITGPVYFYSVTHDDSTGWIYVIPFCKKLSQSEFTPIRKNCKPMASKGQRCRTTATAELKEAGTEKIQKFKLDYFVFGSEKDCVQDRESYTSGDVVPFH